MASVAQALRRLRLSLPLQRGPVAAYLLTCLVGLVGVALTYRAWEINTGRFELTRWHQVTITSKDALFFLILIGVAVQASWFTKWYVSRRSLRWAIRLGVYAVLFALANVLGGIPKY